MGSTDKSRDPASLFQLLASFTNDGTPLEALLGSKVEWGVTVLTAGMLANENLAASMTPEEEEELVSMSATERSKRRERE